MTLREKQSVFATMAARLIQKAFDLGFEVTLGEAWRSPLEAERLAGIGVGISKSSHCDRLAIDLNLFIDSKYIIDPEKYRPLGEFWELLGGIWGGRFDVKKKDYDTKIGFDSGHFEF